MSLRKLPEISVSADARGLESNFAPGVLDRWQGGLRAAEADADNVISIYDVIGEDPWTGGGFTAKRAAAALRAIGARPVTVNINSPGGDVFEGIAIYNLFREHPQAVTVKVLGLAASSASVIAMAGDTVEIARAAFLMMHNVWVMAIGNRNDLRDLADRLDPFDQALADIYAARTGAPAKEMAALMDKETWLSGTQAVAQKFADALLPADAVKQDAKAALDAAPVMALRKIDLALARNGMPRGGRRELIKQFAEGRPSDGGTPGAAAPAMPRAGDAAFLVACGQALQTLTLR